MDKIKEPSKVNGAYIPRSVNAEFRDTITDISYDHFGHRLALSSTDHTIQIWDLSHDGTYHLTSKFRSHSGSVWKVTWAHPEFGQILATCSLDRTAIIWEEVLDATVDTKRSSDQTSHWAKRATLVDSRTSLTDIRFAPKHLGLMLVTCAADGHVRIYEAPDITNLAHWSLKDEFNCKMGCSSITWNQSRIHPPMLAVGSDQYTDSPSPKVIIYEYNEHLRRWIKVDAVASATDPVHDLSFAPYIGRSYHLLGIASKNVQIVTIKSQSVPSATMSASSITSSMVPNAVSTTASVAGILAHQSQPASSSRFDIKTVAQFDDHLSQVWRVSWNITGTILASSGDDGTVRMWKSNYLDNWKPLGVLNDNVGAQTSDQTGDLA